MFSCVFSSGIHGIDCFFVRVEADISDGMPVFDLVGYLSGEVREARERVRTALKNAGFQFPVKRITVNLSPGNIKKHGTGYDLPLAISILAAMGEVKQETLDKTLVVGELMLNGMVAGINGILPMVLKAREMGYIRCIVPMDNKEEAMMVSDIEIVGVKTITGAVHYLNGVASADYSISANGAIADSDMINGDGAICDKSDDGIDLKFVKGQKYARRGLEIAAAGMHNLLMVGAPGAGKSMLAKCIPTILPPLSFGECMEVAAVYSVAGILKENTGLLKCRPFVAPHHTVTDIAMTGGGTYPKPGNISLAHRGVLFLDEMAEFSRYTLEVLRQPLEDRSITVTRNQGTYVYPADFMLVGAMNPCPCGAYPDLTKCTCSEISRKRYAGKISRPLLDRMDICISVEKLHYKQLISKEFAESSECVRKRVVRAQRIQKKRFADCGILFNSQMNSREIDKYCTLKYEDEKWLADTLMKMDVSARAYNKILRVARTIADLEESEDITRTNIAEAIGFNNSYV